MAALEHAREKRINEIIISNLDGTNQIRVTRNQVDESSPLWIQLESDTKQEEKPLEIHSGVGLFAKMINVKNGEKTNLMENIHE